MTSSISIVNQFLQLVVQPKRGGRVSELCGGHTGDQWLYYQPDRMLGHPADHNVYDDVWAGGFEELFPNDAAIRSDGRDLPDHGELWNRPFEVVSQSDLHVQLLRRCTTVPVDFYKAIRLDPNNALVTIDYRLVHNGTKPLWHLLKLHPALRVEDGDKITLPGGSVTPVTPGFGRLSDSRPREWPVLLDDFGDLLDLGTVRSAGSGFREFVYVSDMPAGCCGLRRSRTGERIRITYPPEVFPYCWLFITYGGWREYNTVVLEPCTNMPKDMSEARRRGRCAVLLPDEVRSFSVRIEILGDDDELVC